MSQLHCPTCSKSFNEQESVAMPFCSSRCRQIDLGRWLNEEIGLPVDDAEEDPEFGMN